MKTLLKNHTTLGLREAVRLVRFELSLQGRHRRARRAARAMTGPLQLHLGSGQNRKPGWVNIDAFDPNADLQLDLRERLPFADGSVTFIYSEHFFEHLEYPREVNQLLHEARRVLAPGGRFSVGVPRIEDALRDYVTGDHTWFDNSRTWHPDWATTRAHQINYLFRQGQEHKYAYDFDTLSSVLADAGFIDIAAREWDEALDDPRRKGTMHVEAVNPG